MCKLYHRLVRLTGLKTGPLIAGSLKDEQDLKIDQLGLDNKPLEEREPLKLKVMIRWERGDSSMFSKGVNMPGPRASIAHHPN